MSPDSTHLYDSYEEVYSTKGKVLLAIENYEKAVRLAKEMNDENIELYQKGLEKMKKLAELRN